MKLCRLLFLMIFISINILSCTSEKTEWQGTIEEVDGVTIVKNPKEPMYGEDVFQIDEELSIGEAEGRENYLFSHIHTLDIDNSENIFVVDVKGVHIRVFNKSGEYVRTIGKSGQGPGEFNRIADISITWNNELIVHDRFMSRLTFFSLNGDFLRIVSLKGVQVVDIKLNYKGNYFMKIPRFKGSHSKNTLSSSMEINEYSPDLTLIKTIIKDKFWSQQLRLQPYMIARFTSFDHIICGFRENYEIHVYNPEGDLIRKLIKEYEPIAVSAEEMEKRRLLKAKEVPKHFPAYEDISTDDEGRIYVQTYERHPSEDKFYYDVFDAQGRYIAKVPIIAARKYWKNGKMYTLEEDEEGYQYVKRYKVTWNIH